jgi:hypothetical protein
VAADAEAYDADFPLRDLGMFGKIDESWLPKQPVLTEPKNHTELPRRLLAEEKNMIEAALKESRGRVFGPTGPLPSWASHGPGWNRRFGR